MAGKKNGENKSKIGASLDRSNIQAVQNWSTPANVSSLRQFLGLASYYISKFSTIAAPLTQLTQKELCLAGQPSVNHHFSY